MAKKDGIIKWDEELAEQAVASAAMEASTATGDMFSIKGGILSFNGAPLPGNNVAAIIVSARLHNAFYPDEFNPSKPTNPSCFAFGVDEAAMAPHDQCMKADTAECDLCAQCAKNEWGSADKGKGKACSNGRRLALISAGVFDNQGRFQALDDPKHFADTSIGYLKVPPTSLKGYAAFVKNVALNLKRPPHGVFVKISVVPDQASQMKVTFESLGLVPNSIMGEVMARHKEAEGLIEFPYAPYVETSKAEKRAVAPKAEAAPKASRKAAAQAEPAGFGAPAAVRKAARY
jgi:hypothetical protein